jgi:hypothetical protein
VRINIEVEKDLYKHYGLTESEVSHILELLSKEVERLIVHLYCKYAFEHRTEKNLKLMLDYVNETLLTGVNKAEVIFNKKIKSNLLQVGTILGSMDIKHQKEKYRLVDYLFHLTVIKSQKAFIIIK